MIWTQGAWPDRQSRPDLPLTVAAYRCLNGHVLDPDETRQCPGCGVHDTSRVAEGSSSFTCHRCGESFRYPR